MLISIESQLNVLIYSIIAGMITGVLFDIYRIIRGIRNPKVILTFFSDIIFWILSAFVIFIFLLYTNYAFMEIYIFLYIALGIYIYLKLLSWFFTYINHKIIKTLGIIIRILKNNITYPFELFSYYFKNTRK
ncbi:MAG: spore cortex biosynthesis protein YabQ [Clostridiaceae bacterium]|nr:spore cortex biosynthesis protein YabQ [Clostridiaceae bacterium]